MKIVVCVKYVPDAAGDRTFNADATVDRDGVDGLLSELDEYAVEEALKIRESNEGGVTVLTVGPAAAGNAIRRSLQMGADAGIHVVDEAIHGSDAVATSLVLARAIERQDFDIVLCGMASTDGCMSVVPAMLAERLGVAQLTFASEVTVEETMVRIRRDGDTATETIEASMPVVVSVTDQINEPRYPSFKGIMAAKKKPVETLAVGDLGVSPAEIGLSNAWTHVEALDPRPPRAAGKVVTDDGSGADQLVGYLAEQKFI